MPNQPWKDIYTRQAIEGSLANVRQENDVQSFLGQIATYHLLQKDLEENLSARQSLLRAINATGKRLIINNRKVRKDASANYVIAATADQAIAKANYINTLIQFYQGAGSRFFQDPKALLEYLASPSHPVGELAQLQAACRFEQLDPAHRSFEFDFKKNTDEAFAVGDFTSPMAWAFGEWLEIIVSQPKYGGSKMLIDGSKFEDINTSRLATPFFLWLEKHPVICLPPTQSKPWNSKVADDFWKPDAYGNIEGESVFYSEYGTSIVNNAIAKARYNRTIQEQQQPDPTGAYSEYLKTQTPVNSTKGIHWLYASSDGAVVEMPLSKKIPKKMYKEVKRFDTGHFAGKGENQPHAAAYVWTACGTLLAGEHVTQKFHHSSFVGGQAVRCAGMIRIENGKVSQVSNDSGHYQPSENQLRSFVNWLYQRKVFLNTAQVRYKKMVDGQLQDFQEDVGLFLDPAAETSSEEDPRIAYALENLAARMRDAAQAYRNTYIDPRTGRKKVFRRTSKASLATEAYLSNDFQKDINEAKKNTGNILWWQVPVKVIKAILGMPGVPNPNQISLEIHNTQFTKRASFSPSIARLQPLKKKSTMHKTIVKNLEGWQEPPVSNPRQR